MQNSIILGKTPNPERILPLSSGDFPKYLEAKRIVENPMRFADRIRQLLDRMAATGLLVDMGYGSSIMLPKMYYFIKELTNLQKNGVLWLAPAIGDDFLYRTLSPAIVHITGVNQCGDACGGSGIVFDRHHILTCAHVVRDMHLIGRQVFQGIECVIDSFTCHEKEDIAVVRVSKSLNVPLGLSFSPPTIAQSVLSLGYPKIPFVREAALIMQKGEVTNEFATTLDGHCVFLYSAIARPGNSGGPVVSTDGHIVGMSMQDLTLNTDGRQFSPHFAGIRSDLIAQCVSDLKLGVQIPFETYC